MKAADESDGNAEVQAGSLAKTETPAAAPKIPRNAIIDALLELAESACWDDITILGMSRPARMSRSPPFATFSHRSKVVLAGFSRRIDHIVLDAAGDTQLGKLGEGAFVRMF